MEDELLSKKELLDLTGISYGQLYRWKRKDLIPEDWFIRKSTFTGQETFFPKRKILQRIEKIMNMKDDLSLDDIAGMLSPAPPDVSMSPEEAVKRGITLRHAVDAVAAEYRLPQRLGFHELLYFHVISQLLQAGNIGVDEVSTVYGFLDERYNAFGEKACELLCLRKLGIFSCCLVTFQTEVYFDSDVHVVARVNVSDHVEKVKEKFGAQEDDR